MMEIFGGWIREIVTLVIFVVFLELLIPRSSMERLVRVVAGLLILVTILKPVVVWIHDFHPIEIAAEGRRTDIASAGSDPMRFLKAAYEQGMAHKIKAYLSEKGYVSHDVAVMIGTDAEQITVRSVVIVVEKAEPRTVKADVCRRFALAGEIVTVKRGGNSGE